MVKIAFPGLGIGEFTLNKVAFTLFGKLEVRWYGILITLGIVLAFLYTMYRGKKNENIKSDDVIDIGILTVVLGVIGARLYYVLNHKEGVYDSFLDVIAIWEGGLGIYGGILGGCLGIYIMCKVKKIKWLKLFDMAAPGVMIAQAIGRWGNFFNGEAYGYLITDTTKFYFFNKEHILPSGEGTLFHALRMNLYPNRVGASLACFHPTFFYECVWNLLGFALINLLYKKKRFDGQIALMYFTWYGFGRMFIEGFRTDSLYLGDSNVRVSQLLGLLFFLGGLIALIVLLAMGVRNHEFMTVTEKATAPTEEELTQTAERLEREKEQADERARAQMDTLLDRMTASRAAALERLSSQKSEENASSAEPTTECKTEQDGTEEAEEKKEEAVQEEKSAKAPAEGEQTPQEAVAEQATVGEQQENEAIPEEAQKTEETEVTTEEKAEEQSEEQTDPTEAETDQTKKPVEGTENGNSN